MMDWQTPTVGLVVFAAAAYVIRSALRTFFGSKSGCGSGCGKCGGAATAEPGRIALPRVD
jgi:FeoB-associated Cys-rich membrane protein